LAQKTIIGEAKGKGGKNKTVPVDVAGIRHNILDGRG